MRPWQLHRLIQLMVLIQEVMRCMPHRLRWQLMAMMIQMMQISEMKITVVDQALWSLSLQHKEGLLPGIFNLIYEKGMLRH